MDERMHNITLENRKKLSVTACSEVVSFNEAEVNLIAGEDTLVIKGEGLRVEEVSKTSGDAVITGEVIDSITYSKGHRKNKEGVIRRMFK